jgi:iron complex outermembrane receptor protein
MIRRTAFLGVSFAVHAALAAYPAAALAQEASSDSDTPTLETVVVTAQKRTEDIQNVPISITALSAQALSQAGATGIQDIGMLTPGLQMNSTNGFLTPSIRGVGTNAGGAGLENSVALYVDGVYIGSAPAALLTLSDISQIQVLRGPQGTLFGRNATGGAILVQTLDPVDRPTGTADVSYGNYDTSTVDAYLSDGIAQGLSADISAHVSLQGNGYGRNLYDGSWANRQNLDSAYRSKWLYRPDADTAVRLSFDYYDRYGNLGLSTRIVPGTAPTFTPPYGGSPWDIDTPIDPENHLTGGGASAQIDHDFGWASLTSISAYRRNSYLTIFDGGYQPANVLGLDVDLIDRQFTQELDLKSPQSTGPLTWVAGLYYYQERASYGPGSSVLGPALISPLFPLQALVVDSSVSTHSYAGFAQLSMKLAARTDITLGGRYSWERRALDGTQDGYLLGDILIGTLASADVSTNYSEPTWRAVLDHHFDDGAMAYISYNRGFKSGGYNAMILTDPPFAPETLDAYETGLKSQLLGDRVRLSGALFYYNYHNIQVEKYEGGQIGYYNGAGARMYGIDVDAQAILFTGFAVSGGLSLIHDWFTSFPNALYEIPLATGGSMPVTQSAQGHHLPQTPDATVNLAATYKVATRAGLWSANLAAYYNSGWYGQPDNILSQSAYWLLNANVGWQRMDGRYSVSLWGRNLGNRAYATTLAGTDFASGVQYAQPRTYGVTVGARF